MDNKTTSKYSCPKRHHQHLCSLQFLILLFLFPFHLSRSILNIKNGSGSYSHNTLFHSSRSKLVSSPSTTIFSPTHVAGSLIGSLIFTQYSSNSNIIFVECSSTSHYSPRSVSKSSQFDIDSEVGPLNEGISERSTLTTSHAPSLSHSQTLTSSASTSTATETATATSTTHASPTPADDPAHKNNNPDITVSGVGCTSGCRYVSPGPVGSEGTQTLVSGPITPGVPDGILPKKDEPGHDPKHGIAPVTLAIMTIGVVATIGIIIVGVVVLRRRRQRRGYGDDDFISYQDGGRMRRTDQHVGLHSFSSTGSGLSEPQRQEQFWNA